MAALKTYLIGIAAAALAMSVLSALLRDDALRKTVRLIGGVVLILVALGPVVRADLDAFGQYLSRIEMETDALRTGIEVEDKEIMAKIIQEKTEAYILDKAAGLGADVTAEVTMTMGGDYPYPESVVIRGTLTEPQKNTLSEDLELSLAIPKERQEFLP